MRKYKAGKMLTDVMEIEVARRKKVLLYDRTEKKTVNPKDFDDLYLRDVRQHVKSGNLYYAERIDENVH